MTLENTLMHQNSVNRSHSSATVAQRTFNMHRLIYWPQTVGIELIKWIKSFVHSAYTSCIVQHFFCRTSALNQEINSLPAIQHDPVPFSVSFPQLGPLETNSKIHLLARFIAGGIQSQRTLSAFDLSLSQSRKSSAEILRPNENKSDLIRFQIFRLQLQLHDSRTETLHTL